MEENQSIKIKSENFELIQYIQIVIVVFIVVSQSEDKGHSKPLIRLFLAFRYNYFSSSHYLIRLFLTFFLAV